MHFAVPRKETFNLRVNKKIRKPKNSDKYYLNFNKYQLTYYIILKKE